jgi:hypothetical protein
MLFWSSYRTLEPLQLFYNDPTQFVLLTLGILLVVSPWLLDKLLQAILWTATAIYKYALYSQFRSKSGAATLLQTAEVVFTAARYSTYISTCSTNLWKLTPHSKNCS